MGAKEGIFSSPEGVASVAGLKRLIRMDFVKPEDIIVVYITGSGYKYLDVLEEYC